VTIEENPDNVIIYGSSGDPELFGALPNYATDHNYLEKNYLINFDTLYESHTYRVVSVCYVNDNAEYGEVQDFYKSARFEDSAAFENFVIESKLRSITTVDADILPEDRFLTLVTDVGDWDGARIVVIARMLRDGETPEMASAMFKNNNAAVYPDQWFVVKGTEPTYDEALERDRWRNWLIAFQLDEETTNAINGGPSSQTGGGASEGNGIKINQDGSVLITVYMNDKLVSDTPASIVSQIVSYEMPAATSDEAIKALAVAVASKLRYDLEFSADAPSLSGVTPTDKVRRLVEEVIDQCVLYEGKVAQTLYFQLGYEYTYSASDVWGSEDIPYLHSVETVHDQKSDKQPAPIQVSLDTVKQRLERNFGITLSDNHNNWIKVTSHGGGGVVTGVSIDGQTTATGFQLMNIFTSEIKSPNFSVEWTDTGAGTFLSVQSYGNGHGVGMSEIGADLYASEQGWDFKQILEHYYTGVTIGKMDWQIGSTEG